MPEYLEEKRRKAEERKAFVTKVWEQAIRDAGLINKKLNWELAIERYFRRLIPTYSETQIIHVVGRKRPLAAVVSQQNHLQRHWVPALVQEAPNYERQLQ
jgi:hypothetical protein